jgi:hypothetical protein
VAFAPPALAGARSSVERAGTRRWREPRRGDSARRLIVRSGPAPETLAAPRPFRSADCMGSHTDETSRSHAAFYWGEGLEGVSAGRASDVQSGPL